MPKHKSDKHRSDKHRSDSHKSQQQWSNWYWSLGLNVSVRCRERSNGDWVYEDREGQSVDGNLLGELVEEDPATPRDTPVDALTESFAHISTNAEEEDFEPEYSLTGAREQPVGEESGRRHRGKGKDKSKHVTYEDHLDQDPAYGAHGNPIYEQGSAGTFEPTSLYSPYDASEQSALDLDQALTASRQYQDLYPPGGASSSRAYAPLDVLDEEYPLQTPPVQETNPIIQGSGDGKVGDRETLDKRYKIHNSKKFKPGEVFKVLWPEPMGAMPGAPTISDKGRLKDKYGGMVHVGFRRFIVIRTDEGHSTCVPILTYGDQGCTKRGVKAHHHGIIYTSSKPRMLRGEPSLGAIPVRMNISEKGEKLSDSSRANYSKMMTIEHNVKVFFIGSIAPDEFPIVDDAVDRCWEAKLHHTHRSFQ